jgi:HEAT repeat protein
VVVILCPKCWSEIDPTHVVCDKCGAMVDLYSRSYEQQLVGVLENSEPQRRALICRILGCRGKSSAIPALVELLHDPDVVVCEAALRALGEIGDVSAAEAVRTMLASENDDLRSAARCVLRTLTGVTV